MMKIRKQFLAGSALALGMIVGLPGLTLPTPLLAQDPPAPPAAVEAAPAAATPPAEPAKSAAAQARPAPSAPEIQEIIRKFAEHEDAFARARENYTYRQIIKVEELDDEGKGGGRMYTVESDIIFSAQGRRTEKVVFAPISTLRRISISPEDERDLRGIQPFVLNSADLLKYDVRYQGRQKVDELDTYAFRVSPKVMEKGERYFDGIVWVDERDLQIVKSYGKAVPDIRGSAENLFPRFETYREQIDGKYWFPTWTGADDTLHFKTGPVRIRMIVRYQDYKQFKTDVNITYGDEATTPPVQQ
ncbi:MAG: hypothetical protein EXQ56_05840 [Acidobacteria bacterium]|nr:hypothetical protein [Acidobacteriota bacterium]